MDEETVECEFHPGSDITSELLCEACYAETQFGDNFMRDKADNGD